MDKKRRNFLKNSIFLGTGALIGSTLGGCGEESNLGNGTTSPKLNKPSKESKIERLYNMRVKKGALSYLNQHRIEECLIDKKTLEHTLIKSTENRSPGILKIWDTDNTIRYSIKSNDSNVHYLINNVAKEINEKTPINMIESNSNINLEYQLTTKEEHNLKFKYLGPSLAAFRIRFSAKNADISIIKTQKYPDLLTSILQETIGALGLVKDIAEFKNTQYKRSTYTILDDYNSLPDNPKRMISDFDESLLKIMAYDGIIFKQTTADDLIKLGVVDNIWAESEDKHGFKGKYTEPKLGYMIKMRNDLLGTSKRRKEFLDMNEFMKSEHPNYDKLKIRNMHLMSRKDQSAMIVKSYCSYPEKFNYLE